MMPAAGMVAVMGSSLLHEDPRDRSGMDIDLISTRFFFFII